MPFVAGAEAISARIKGGKAMLKIIGSVAIAIGVAQAAQAADWRLAAESDRAVSYLDTASIAKTGDKVQFARWMVLRVPTAGGTDNIKDSFEATCGTQAYRVISAQSFAGAREGGRLPVSAGTAEPGSVTASLIAIACGQRKPAGEAVGDPYLAGKGRLKATPAG